MKYYLHTSTPAKLFFLLAVCLLSYINPLAQSNTKAVTHYQCIPCGSHCDTLIFSQPGKCPHCGMELVKKLKVKMNTIKPSEICGYLKNNPGVLLLDVRTREEFEGEGSPDYGTLNGSINIPVQQLASRLSELNRYREKEIIVYCSHSQRSPRAAYLLLQNGFTLVTNMAGGMSVMKDDTCKK
jgi:rhodanese-related sulfurtransferase/DNA-directed RNA polymerase subunit RPC12/RpoP